ncbi:ankyrin repeat and IBR domain-containing protein 1-like [Dreissena polymorpha]|uniref:ankyrin repeat and IBR domain-containing protein 1-like n=1 Tax=Dreissena polymorpha TaxID=45954 RepID=UPI002263E60D|nr:ankyrin repeat and IBR domain-containing protein 1-like [Dreissena polymorpha]
MGSSSSKFRKHLQTGDEVAALKVYNDHSDLRKGLDPNSSYGDNHQHETPLHLAARHGMKSLLRIFLFEHGGNPNKTNGKKETALHCVCMEKHHQYFPVQRRRLECLSMILQWKGAELKDGVVEKVDLSALDESNNTALHYAAESGLKACVEQLVNHSCPLFIENKDNQTPCDSAESSGFNDIALYLESKMVFSNDGAGGDIDEVPPEIDSEEYSGLRAQDLQEAKDQLLVETADMLSIPLFTAEALLRNHEWSREMLLDAWMADPVSCCEKSGVTAPASLFSDKPIVAESLSSPTVSHPPCSLAECDICTQTFQLSQEPVHMSCHQFCRECWEGYLNVKIKEGGVHDITCPGYGCNILVPVEVIESVVSRDMARRYLQFDIKAFVDSNPNIKWCPFPGCGRAVRLPEVIQGGAGGSRNSPGHKIPADTSRAVDCGNGHYFCWECSGEAHEPCSCDSLRRWLAEVAEIKPETLHNTEQETETAANCLWLVTNSKLCPQCKSPIQKNEGCNHMKCSKCKHDFCWVCLDQWKRHNSSTGGYFKCNRYEVSKKVEDTTKMSITEAESKNSKMQELNKFVHYYTRYKNHENSYKFEEPLMKTAKEKMLKLAEAVNDLATAKDETKFVEEAVHKLLKSRRVLKYSYVYGYYLDGPAYRKIVFEFMQTELEECTEILSQMVNRLYLRTPRKKIIEQAQLCHRKRHDFLTAISKGLVPPETPPGLRKKRRRYSMDVDDEDMRKAILASIEDFDPENPWIVDASGRHTNIAAILDWPSDDSDDETPSRANKAMSMMDPMPEMCTRECCARPCAKNPRTGEYHKFCSLRCSRMHKQRLDDEPLPSMSEMHMDERMDILRALEMSRIQFLQDQGILSQAERSEEPSSSSNNRQASREATYTPSETLDIEIRRLLELTSLLDDNEETDLKTSLDQSGADDNDRPFSLSRFGENQSTVVSRVPNKSVEDLYHPDCSSCQAATSLSPLVTNKYLHTGEPDLPSSECPPFDDLEVLGACGGISVSSIGEESENQSVDDFSLGGPILQKLLNMDAIDKSNGEPIASCRSFGPIKDISVSNIHIDEDDKTKNFMKKDFSNLSRSKPKVVEHGNGRLFSANTPGEDEKVFTLLSPESDFSESSSSEVWGYRPQLVHEPKHMHTPETDSSVEGCSCADLPNQNSYYRHDDTLSETSPLTGEEENKLLNLIGQSEHASTNQRSFIELTETMLKMTLDMQNELELDSYTQVPPAQFSKGSEVMTFPDDIISINRQVSLASLTGICSEAEKTDDKQAAGHGCSKENVCEYVNGETQQNEKMVDIEVTLESEENENADGITLESDHLSRVLTDCEVIDLESPDALMNVDPITMYKEEEENFLQNSGDISLLETVDEGTTVAESRSTYV